MMPGARKADGGPMDHQFSHFTPELMHRQRQLMQQAMAAGEGVLLLVAAHRSIF
jgi:hypothetical protein